MNPSGSAGSPCPICDADASSPKATAGVPACGTCGKVPEHLTVEDCLFRARGCERREEKQDETVDNDTERKTPNEKKTPAAFFSRIFSKKTDSSAVVEDQGANDRATVDSPSILHSMRLVFSQSEPDPAPNEDRQREQEVIASMERALREAEDPTHTFSEPPSPPSVFKSMRRAFDPAWLLSKKHTGENSNDDGGEEATLDEGKTESWVMAMYREKGAHQVQARAFPVPDRERTAPFLRSHRDLLWLKTSEGHSIPAVHIGKKHRFTIIYSHANGEDLGYVIKV